MSERSGPSDPKALELDLDLPSASPAPSASSSPSSSAPVPVSGGTVLDDDDGIQPGSALPIELDEAAAPAPKPVTSRPSAPRSGTRSAAPSAPPSSSSRRIHVSRHAKDARPTGLPSALGAIVLVAALVVATPFVHPDGVARVQSWLARQAFIPYAALGGALLLAWAATLARAIHHGSLVLHVAAAALVAEMILLALAAAYLASGSTTTKAFLRLMPAGAPIIAAAVTAGLSGRALGRALEELRASDRRMLLGLLHVVLGLAGIAVAVRLGRYDLPLPRLGEPVTLTLW